MSTHNVFITKYINTHVYQVYKHDMKVSTMKLQSDINVQYYITVLHHCTLSMCPCQTGVLVVIITMWALEVSTSVKVGTCYL